MKKRILAFALTLAMVITSLSMLSFVSFAEGESTDAPAVVAEDFYAYRATATIDAALGLDELYVPVQRKVAPNVAMGVAWDYENVYVILYQEPATNGVAGARKDYLENGTLTIGGVAVALDWATGTFTAPEGSAVKAKLGGNYDVEIAVPLSEITLDAEALAAGKAIVPMAMNLNTMVGTTSTLTAKNFNLILTGRSVIAEMNNINPAYGHSGVANMFAGGHIYDRGAGKAVTDEKIVVKGGNAGNGYWSVKDDSTYVGQLEVLRYNNDIANYININDGGKNYYEFEFNIANLPVGAITTNDTITTFNNSASNIQIAAAGAHATVNRTFLCWLYNDADKGLCLAYYNGTGTPSILDLGVDMGETFVLGMREVTGGSNNGKYEIYVNDVLATTYTGALATYSLSADCGGVYVGYHRGNQNNYSLDIDANGTVDADERVEFTMSGFVLAKDADVDVATVASLTKNGGTATSAVLTAYTTPDPTASINVGSMAKAFAYYDYANAVAKIAVETANVNKVSVKLGGFTANVIGFTQTAVKSNPDTITPILDEESIAKGVKAYTYDRTKQYTVIELPLEYVYVQKNEAGNAFADITIEITKEDQVIQNPGAENERVRAKNATKASTTGVVVFDLWVLRYFKATVSNHSVAIGAAAPVTGFAGYGPGAVGGASVSSLSADQQSMSILDAASTLANRQYVASTGVNALATAGDRNISFTINIKEMVAYDFAANGGYSIAAEPFGRTDSGIWSDIGSVRAYERLIYSVCAKMADGRNATMSVQFARDVNDGLVLLHTAIDGTVTAVVIGDANLGKDVNVKFLWNNDESGAIYINNTLKASFDATEMSCVNAKENVGNFVGTNLHKYIGFNFMRGTTAGAKTIEWSAEDIMDKASAYDLSVPFAQLAYVQESPVVADTFSIRLIAIMNTLDASTAGFVVSVKGSDVEPTTYATDTVYKSFWQKVDGKRELVEAGNGAYFLAVTIPLVDAYAIPEVAPTDDSASAEPTKEPVTVTYVVKPYFVTEGETTYGVEYEITYTAGVFMGAEIVR